MKLKFCFWGLFILMLFGQTVLAGFEREESEIFLMINYQREKENISALKWNKELADVARIYSKKMAGENFFSHTDPKGFKITDRVSKKKLNSYSVLGENLYYCANCVGFGFDAVTGWLNSPPHKQNLLDKIYTSTGIGIAESKDGKFYITQVFLGN